MNRIAHLAAGAVLLACAANTVGAQEPVADRGPFLKAPVFALQPGFLTTDVISAPEGAESNTNFNARFITLVPTASPYFTLLAGAQWGAAGDATGDDATHGPIIFYGAIIPIPGILELTQGWLSLSVDPLGVTVGPGSEGTDFWLEGAAVLNIGAKMMTNSPWRGLGIYALLDQKITRLGDDPDRFNPVLLTGLSLPIAPWGP